MRVTQTINIGTLRINSMSNSSIVQVGASGGIKARAKEITEVIPQAEAGPKIEGEVNKAVKPLMDKEGIPVTEKPPAPKQAGPGAPVGAGVFDTGAEEETAPAGSAGQQKQAEPAAKHARKQ